MTTKYDANFVDEVLSLDQTISVELARALGKKYHKETEMDLALQSWKTQSTYRKPDLTNLVHRVLNQEKVIDEESLEEKALVPYKPKSSAYRTIADVVAVAGAGTKDLIHKTHWYYPLLGALPEKYQEKIAGRRYENSRHYTIANTILEPVALGVTGCLLFGPVALGAVALYSFFISVGRILASSIEDHNFGSPLVTIPYYLALGAILGITAAGKGIKNSYASAWEKRKALTSEIKRLENNKLRIEPAEPTQIVDAELIEAEQEVEESLAPVKHYYGK